MQKNIYLIHNGHMVFFWYTRCWKGMMMNSYLRVYICLGLMIAVGAGSCLIGCTASGSKAGDSTNNGSRPPRVLSIGSGSTLTFQKDHRIEIPIDMIVDPGEGLRVTQIAVTATGTAPLERGDDYWVEGLPLYGLGPDEQVNKSATCVMLPILTSGQEELINSNIWYSLPETNYFDTHHPVFLVINKDYASRLKTHDRLSVRVDYNTYDFSNQVSPDSTSSTRDPKLRGSVSRAFTFAETSDYRQGTLSNLLPIGQIAAFPLPEKEAKALFGEKVSKRYFVVRLAIRNVDSSPILVSTGMIQAGGRLLVMPSDQTNQFSIPVAVTPQSWEAVYAILERDEVKSGRSQFFRGLKFVGSLATAWGNAASWGADAISGLGVYTGVFIPEAEKFHPDPFDSYKRNLVNFSMQEHMKIPQNTVSKSRFVFFSKDSVEALVSDSNLQNRSFFGGFPFFEETIESSLVYLEIGTLSIPYDVITGESDRIVENEAKKRAQILNSLNQFKNILNELKQLRSNAQKATDTIVETTIKNHAGKQVQEGAELISRLKELDLQSDTARTATEAQSYLDQAKTYESEASVSFHRAEAFATFAKESPAVNSDIHASKQVAYMKWRTEVIQKLLKTETSKAINELLDENAKKMIEFKKEVQVAQVAGELPAGL